MSELIRRKDAINAVETFFKDAHIKDSDVHCTDMLYEINHIPTACVSCFRASSCSPWHRVEDGLPEMSEIVPGFVCSEILVLCDAKSGNMGIGYVREKPNGVDWMWGKDRTIPTHWMPIEPPKEDV